MDTKDLKTLIAARDVLDKLINENQTTNAGAGKEDTTSVIKPAKKAASSKKPVAKMAAGEEESKPAAIKPVAKNTDGKRKITFGVKDLQTIALKKGLGLPEGKLNDEQTKQYGDAKTKIVKHYINELSDEDFDKKTIVEHIDDWLKIQNDTKAEAVEEFTFDIVSYDELKDMKLTTTKKAGIYWHPETGRHVTGPAEVDDEDMDEKDDYFIGETTKRVYKEVGDKMEFQHRWDGIVV